MLFTNIVEFSKIEKCNKFNGYQLKIADNVLEFFRYVWKSEDKPQKEMEDLHIVSYNFLFPSGGINLTTTWNQKKENVYKINDKNTLVIGKFSITYVLELNDK
jgi:hypothetical protein